MIRDTGVRLNIEDIFFRYRDSHYAHYKDKRVSWASYRYNKNPIHR